MARWFLVAVLLAGCQPPLSERQFCTKQQMAWESAYPAVPQTDEQRMSFIDNCMAGIDKKHATGEYDRSVTCFDKNVTGRGHALEEYLAFKKCEASTPLVPPKS